MADHKVSVAVSLLVFSLLGFRHVGCQQSNFRVFRTGAELREFEQLSARERLGSALLFPGAAILEITGANQAATVQEDVALNIDCLPWLRRFPGGSIQWFSIQLNEFGQIADPTADPSPENPTPPGMVARIMVGGEFNRWLNISRIEVVGGAEDPDSKIFQCQVCIARGTPFEQCHTANYTNLVTGSNPVVNTTGINECRQGANAALPGPDGGIVLTETLPCPIPNEIPRPVPLPTRTWFRDGVLAASALRGETVNVDMAFLMQFPILNMGAFDTAPFQVLVSGDLVFTTAFTNITNPMMAGLAPGTTLSQARAMLFDILLANWTCVANNSLGASSISNFIRMCGDNPVIPDCAAADGSRVLFLNDGDMAPPGCDVCILEDTSVTLNCMVSSGAPPISYSWIMNGVEVSQNPRLTVREPGNYSCTATNPDSVSVMEASVLFFSPQATLTSRIVGRTTDGCERLSVSGTDLAAIREQFDTCIFVDETLEVECTSDNPDAQLALRSEDGTMYENATARFVVTMGSGFDAANQTFMCAITNAQGSCGGFIFRSSVIAYDPAEIDRTVPFIDPDHLGAGRPEDVVVGTIDTPETLRCPTSGIPDETTQWWRVVEDSTGCFIEQPISSSTDGFTVTLEMTGPNMLDDLVLTIDNFNATFEGTYVCRTENIAGADADIVSLVTGLGSPEWRTTSFSECTMMCEEGVRSRSVTCRNSRDSLLIPDFMCQDVPGGAGPRPVSSLQCDDLFPLPCFNDPVWVPHPWSRCSQDCKGTRTRRVLCQVPRTGEVRPNYECDNLVPKPTRFELCPDTCCVSDVYPDICSLLGSGYCGTLAFQKLCCWTCGLTVIP